MIPPHAGRDSPAGLGGRTGPISIHPPLAGRDREWRRVHCGTPISIPPPLAGRDTADRVADCRALISIHPPLAGRDQRAGHGRLLRVYFNPPAPCGAGQVFGVTDKETGAFQSTRPLRGGTSAPAPSRPASSFQSTRPLRGGTGEKCCCTANEKFQSTRPLRGGTAILHKKTVQNIAYCTKSAFTLAVLSGFLALMRPFFLPNVHKFRCEPSEESLLAPRSHAYTIRTPSC